MQRKSAQSDAAWTEKISPSYYFCFLGHTVSYGHKNSIYQRKTKYAGDVQGCVSEGHRNGELQR